MLASDDISLFANFFVRNFHEAVKIFMLCDSFCGGWKASLSVEGFWSVFGDLRTIPDEKWTFEITKCLQTFSMDRETLE